jgi:hypothetical protein
VTIDRPSLTSIGKLATELGAAPLRSAPEAASATRRRTAPVALLLAPVIVAAGVTVLVWDYALLPPNPTIYMLYWLGLGLAYAGVVILGTVQDPRLPRQLSALGVFGAVTWLPYLLRSPERLLFVDERYHQDVVLRLAEQGHTGLPVTLYPLPGVFPGLEDATLGLMAWTGLPPDAAMRLMTLSIHALIPMLAYLGARGVGLDRRGAFIAALVYCANTSFFFFHSVFSYESLGILFFLSTWALVGLYRGSPWRRRILPPPSPTDDPARLDTEVRAIELSSRRRRGALLLVALPILAGIAVTHHLSSYLLVISLAMAWFSALFVPARSTKGIRNLTFLAAFFAVAWFLVSAAELAPYLFGTIADRVRNIVDTLLVERSQPRPLFANSDLPIVERIIAFGYPPLVLLLSLGGLVVAWRNRTSSVFWLPYAVVGPIAWVATIPAVITRSGELAYRAWPFLFLGVALFASLALLATARVIARRWPGIAPPVVFAIVGVLLFGGFSIGDNQAGRFPGQAPVTSSGSANATDDAVAAASWLRRTAGDYHRVATDGGTGVTFATAGRQQIVRWESWYPFVVVDPTKIVPFMLDDGVEYLVVDLDITRLPPRYGRYFGEPPIPADLDPGQPFPAALLDRLDTVTGLERAYDGGRIRIYQVISTAAVVQ